MTTQEFGPLCLFVGQCNSRGDRAVFLAELLKDKHNKALMKYFKETGLMLQAAANKLQLLAEKSLMQEKEAPHA